jgi:hypothetical protein
LIKKRVLYLLLNDIVTEEVIMLNNIMVLLQGIIELIGFVAFCLALVRVPLFWGRITVVGTLLFIITYIIRELQSTFGLHTVILLFLLSLFMRKITHTTPVQGFKAGFIGLIVLTLLEVIIFKLFTVFTKYEQNEIITNDFLWRLLGLPQGILMIIFAIIISRYKKPDEGAWRI